MDFRVTEPEPLFLLLLPAARQEPDLAYGEAPRLKLGRVRPPRELVYAAEASHGSPGIIIVVVCDACAAARLFDCLDFSLPRS